MQMYERIYHNIEILQKYISEHGNEFGTVSWQMAEWSLSDIKEDFNQLMSELSEEDELEDEDDNSSQH